MLREGASQLLGLCRYTPKEVEQAKVKVLTTYCGAIVEDKGEDMEEAIMGGKFDDTTGSKSFDIRMH